jgi:hypothetical protein
MLRSPRRLLRWISLLFAWAILAYAAHATLDIAASKSTLALSASTATYRSAPETAAGGRSSEDAGRTCGSLFGSYDWWLFSPNRRGLCGLATRTTLGSAPDRSDPGAVVPN